MPAIFIAYFLAYTAGLLLQTLLLNNNAHPYPHIPCLHKHQPALHNLHQIVQELTAKFQSMAFTYKTAPA